MGWTTQSHHRPSTHLGFSSATSEKIDVALSALDASFLFLDDPWPNESNGRNSATAVSDDPWQSAAPSSATHANPWDGQQTSAASNTNGAGLSLNMADPWGTGATNGARATTSPPSKTVNNELSEFFGASASKICSMFAVTENSTACLS